MMDMEEKPLVTPEVAATWAADNRSIYSPDFAAIGAPGTAQAGEAINPGLVVDVNAARDIATERNEKGEIAADAREKQLEREAKTGLTDQQKEYAEIMDNNLKFNKDGKEINTHAFRELVDNKGRKYMVLHMTPLNANSMDKLNNYIPGGLTLICKDGPIVIQTNEDTWRLSESASEDDVLKKINLDEIGDKLEDPEANNLPPLGDTGVIKHVIADDSGPRESSSYIYRINLADHDQFKEFAKAVKISEQKGLKIEKSAPKMVKATGLSFG